MSTVANRSLAQQFATRYAEGVVPAVIKAITWTKRGVWALLIATVVGTYMHQASFLATQGLGFSAWLFPAVVDAGILLMMIVTQTRAIKAPGKAKARKVAVVLAVMSMTLNAIAPGSPVARAVAPSMVLVAALVEMVVSAIEVDFTDLETAETEARATAPARRTMSEESKAKARATREANAQAKAEADEARRERRRLARLVREAEARGDIEASWAGPTAPVSPAPTEWRSDISYM